MATKKENTTVEVTENTKQEAQEVKTEAPAEVVEKVTPENQEETPQEQTPSVSEADDAYAQELCGRYGTDSVFLVGKLYFRDKKQADGRALATGQPVIEIKKK